MGLVYADIELANDGDHEMVRRGLMDKDEVRRIPVTALVDTGSFSLAINQTILEILQLSVVDRMKLTIASGEIVYYAVVSNVQIRFKNRTSSCRAVILPGNSEPLLGAIPLEEMDLIIHPKRQELMTNPEHGEDGLWMLKGYKQSWPSEKELRDLSE